MDHNAKPKGILYVEEKSTVSARKEVQDYQDACLDADFVANHLASRNATPVPALHYNPGHPRRHPVSKFDCEDVVNGVRTLIDRKYVKPGEVIGTWPKAKRGYFRQLDALDQNLQAGHPIRIRYEISEPGQQVNLKKKLLQWVKDSDLDGAKKSRYNDLIEKNVEFSHVPAS